MEATDAIKLNRQFRIILLALVASIVVSGAWAASPKIAFNIPAGPLSEAIIEFSKQSQLEVLYASLGSVSGVRTPAVVGELGVSEAMARLLEGTGFTFEFESARSILVKRTHTAATLAEVGPASTENTAEANTRLANLQSGLADVAPEMQEVVVTGSYLHGARDIVSPLVILGTKEKKQAAYATVQDVLQTLPLNYGGAPSEQFSVNANFNRGTGVNLHGLGSGATLVLVNGYRQPVSGIDGDFVDVSTIPLNAVERIEVLPDGSSALYGSDAIAGVVNIILRKDLTGAETSARAGTALGGGNEKTVSQLLGNHWDTGQWLFAYQYSQRSDLPAADRAYAASADKRPFGGTDLRSISSNPGNILDPVTLQPLFAIPSGQDGRALTRNELLSSVVNRQNQSQWQDILPERSAHSAYLTVSQELGDRFKLFGEARYNQRRIAATEVPYDQLLFVPLSNPFNHLGSDVVVAYNFSREFGPIRDSGVTETYTGTVGLEADIGRSWHATFSDFHGVESMQWQGRNLVDFVALDEKLADPDPATAFNPFGDGSNTSAVTLAALRRVQIQRAVSTIDTANLVVDGSLPEFLSVTPRLALGVDLRRESLNRDMIRSQYDRRIAAAFTELSIPISWRLDFSLAARYEKYSDFGGTYNPKMGFHWSLNKSLRFRGSWGTSFKAPSLVDLYDHSQDVAFLQPLADAHSLTGYSNVLIRLGSNPDLHEARASTWTAGIDFAPTFAPGLTLSSTYYLIDYQDQPWHYNATIPPESLLAEDQWKSLVTRDPSRAEVDAICHSKLFLGAPSDCLNPPDAILDIRAHNLSATTAKGIDFELKQALPTKYGGFDFGLDGSYLLSFEQALTRAATPIDIVNTQSNPPRLRFRGTGDWHRHGQNQPGFGVSIAIDYLSGSRDEENAPVTRIPAWVTLDMQLNYRTQKIDHWLGDVELTLNAVNLFNKDPPFVNRVEGYDPVNAKPYGRVVGFEIQKNW